MGWCTPGKVIKTVCISPGLDLLSRLSFLVCYTICTGREQNSEPSQRTAYPFRSLHQKASCSDLPNNASPRLTTLLLAEDACCSHLMVTRRDRLRLWYRQRGGVYVQPGRYEQLSPDLLLCSAVRLPNSVCNAKPIRLSLTRSCLVC